MKTNPYQSPKTTDEGLPNSDAKDYTAIAATYLNILGFVHFLGFDLLFFLFLWFSREIRSHNGKYRLATIVLCSLHLLIGIALLLAAHLFGPKSVDVHCFFGTKLDMQSLWPCDVIGAVLLVIYGLPIIWLCRPGTRCAFRIAAMQQNKP